MNENISNIEDGDQLVMPDLEATGSPEDTVDTPPSSGDENPNIPPDTSLSASEVAAKFAPRKEDDLGDHLKEDAKPPAPGTAEAEVYGGVATILKGQGFFEGQEDLKVTNAEELAAAFNKEVLARVGDREKEALEYKNQGINFSEMDKIDTAIRDTNTITPEQLTTNESLAMQLVTIEWNQKGLDGAKYAEMFKENGQLVAEASTALASRKSNLLDLRQGEIDRAAEVTKATADKKAADLVAFEKSLDADEIFGRKIATATKEKLRALITTPVGYTPDGDPVNQMMDYKEKNPVEFEKNLSYLFLVTNGFKDLNTFDRSAETRTTKQFRESVQSLSAAPDMLEKQPQANTIDMNNIDDIV